MTDHQTRLGRTAAFAAALSTLVLAAPVATAQERTEFRVAWSIYVGWMPWGYMSDSGIMDKWADKYGIDVEIVHNTVIGPPSASEDATGLVLYREAGDPTAV
ncbi:MAG: hypothetical protein AAFR79_21100, partial [Pseudomonadota bacterium]